jgi:hypothetical protein
MASAGDPADKSVRVVPPLCTVAFMPSIATPDQLVNNANDIGLPAQPTGAQP